MHATEAQLNGHSSGGLNGHAASPAQLKVPANEDVVAADQAPRNLEAEQALIGAALVDKRVLKQLPPGFNSYAFSVSVHGEIFAQIVGLVAAGKSADFVTVGALFASAELIDGKIQVPKYIEWLALSVPTTIAAPNYAALILDCARGRLRTVGDDRWRADLIRTATGAIKPLLANAILAFRNAPEWRYVLGFDELAMATTLLSRPPFESDATSFKNRPWTPTDDALATEWLQLSGIPCGLEIAQQAIDAVAQETTFHPIRDYFWRLHWDGKPRIESFASKYLGAVDTQYAAAVSRCVLISGAARIMQPGCKADLMMVIEGDQGIGKSTAIRALGGTWSTDEIADFGSKDAALQIRGAHLIEISELDAMSRMEVARVKAFISRSTDRFRPPYGRRVIDSPRQSIFIGTTNSDQYLKDETGARRFLPIKAGRINVAAIKRDRDQLWAEALARYQKGEPWWLTPAEARIAAEEQAERYVEDPWQITIDTYLRTRTKVKVAEILFEVLCLEHSKQGQAEQNRVARCLRVLGWKRHQFRDTKGCRYYAYTRDTAQSESSLEIDECNVTSRSVMTA